MSDIVKVNTDVATVEKHIPQVGDYYTDRDGMILIRDITQRTVNGSVITFYVCSEINEHFEPYESTDEKTLDTLNEHYKYLPDARKHWDDAEKLLNGELVLDIADGERDYTVVNTYAVVEGGNLKLLQSQKQALSDANERAEHILAAARAKIEIVQARMEHERRKLEKYKDGIMKQIERKTYREKCKHRNEYGTCLFYTGWFGSFHVTCGCVPSAKCRRMKRYDKLNPTKILKDN